MEGSLSPVALKLFDYDQMMRMMCLVICIFGDKLYLTGINQAINHQINTKDKSNYVDETHDYIHELKYIVAINEMNK